MTTNDHISVTVATEDGGTATIEMPLQPERTQKHGWRLRHAKNYIGVPLAAELGGDLEAVISDRLVGMTREATNGARAVNLITDDNNASDVGAAFIAACEQSYGSIDDGLAEIESSTYKRLADAISNVAPAMQVVMAQYPPVAEIITLLTSDLTPVDGCTLPELVTAAISEDCGHFLGDILSNETPPFVPADAPTQDELESGEFYTGTYTHHFKSILYHTGILTESGSDSSSFKAKDSIWELDPGLTKEAQETATSVAKTNAWEN